MAWSGTNSAMKDQLVIVNGIGANGVVTETGDTGTIRKETHAGRVTVFGKTSGTVLTLPAATGTGDTYTFIIGTAATSNANIIKVANATDVMNGSMILQQDTDAAGTLKLWAAATSDDTVSLAGAATTGGIKGNRIVCTDYASGFWNVTGWTQSSGGSEATPFSATVS